MRTEDRTSRVLERWHLDPVLPPEPHLHPARFPTVSEWRRALRREGYSMPLPMARGLEWLMQRDQLNLSEALALAYWEGGVTRVGRLFVYDLAFA